MGFPGGSAVKSPPVNAGDTGEAGLILGREDPMEWEKMASHSSILTWEILWTEDLAGYSLWGHKETDGT